MKKVFFWIVFGVIIATILYVYVTNNLEPAGLESKVETYETASIGQLQLTYRSTPGGYELLQDVSQWRPEGIVSNAILVNKSERLEAKKNEFQIQTPPTVVIELYENKAELTPLQWAEGNVIISNIQSVENDVSVSVTPLQISGVEGIAYSGIGLSLFDYVVFDYQGIIYVLSVWYDQVDDQKQQDFRALVTSLDFK